MKLYMVEDVDNPNAVFFYWAENEGEALDEHEAQVNQPDTVNWAASPVWANNSNSKYRGFVINNQEDKNED